VHSVTHNPSWSSETRVEASKEQLNFNKPHPPAGNALEAFSGVVDKIKREIIKSRHHWDAHEPRMWSRARGLSDHDLTRFNINEDLVLVSSASTTYGTIILGKIRIPAINDDQGEGFIHVRCVPCYSSTMRRIRNGDLTSVDPRGPGSMTLRTEYCRCYLLPPISLLI